MQRLAVLRVFVVIGVFSNMSLIYADTVMLKPVADTSLFQFMPDNNLGSETFLPIGVTGTFGAFTRLRGLIQFDLSQIPANATVSSATLRVQVVFGSGANTAFDLHRMLQSWAEGNKSGGPDKAGTLGAPATAGESDWNHRQHVSVAWGSPGGSAGVDYVSTATAFITVTPPTSYTFSNATVTADVQRWVTNAASNFGWLIKSRNEGTSAGGTARRFGSREDDPNAPVLTVTFTASGAPPTITTSSPLPAGGVGTAYSQTFTATGGTSPYTWSLNSGTLPSGLGLSGTGVLTGTPTNAGNFNFSVRLTDGAGKSATNNFALAINPVALAITTTSPLPAGAVGAAYSQTLTASGGTLPYSWTVSTGMLPGGMSFSSGGVLSGTPTNAGTFNFTVQVTDSLNIRTNTTFDLTITAALRIAQTKVMGGQFSFTFVAQAGQTYAAEVRPSLQSDNWTVLTNIPVHATSTVLTVTDSIAESTRFYRLRTP